MRAAGVLDPQGPVAESIAGLWWLMLVLGVSVYGIFLVALARSLRRRERRVEDPRTPVRWIVTGGVAMPAVVLTVVLVATVRSMRSIPVTAPPASLVVEVVGHQWWWEIHYPGEGVATANELHIPVGRPVSLDLRSADVIHSFWVPALGGKTDLLPDRTNTLVLQADEPGEHRTHCAEFCGVQHAHHKLVVVAEDPEAFSAWLDRQRRPPTEPTGPQERRGRDIFMATECAECHTVGGTPAAGTRGPDLSHVAGRRLLAGTVPNTPEHLAEWIADPSTIKPGAKMPAAGSLSREDLDALVAYVRGLR